MRAVIDLCCRSQVTDRCSKTTSARCLGLALPSAQPSSACCCDWTTPAVFGQQGLAIKHKIQLTWQLNAQLGLLLTLERIAVCVQAVVRQVARGCLQGCGAACSSELALVSLGTQAKLLDTAACKTQDIARKASELCSQWPAALGSGLVPELARA